MEPGYKNLGQAILAGFLATLIATWWGFIETGVGLPRLDLLTAAGSKVAPEGASPAFVYNWGAILHYLDGVTFAILYDRFFYSRLPGPDIFRGVIYGILVWVGAGLVYLPLVGAGLFGAHQGGPFLWAILIWHLVWGVALGVFYVSPRQPAPPARPPGTGGKE